MNEKIELVKAPTQKSAVLNDEEVGVILAALAAVIDLGDVSTIKQIGLVVNERGNRFLVVAA